MQSIGPLFGMWAKYLGDQWSIGDWDGFVAGAPRELVDWLAFIATVAGADAPPQSLREYDPEWGRPSSQAHSLPAVRTTSC